MAAQGRPFSMANSEVSLIVVPFPAQGHLNQLLHLSRLLSDYNLPINFISTTLHTRQLNHRLHGWDPLSASNIIFHHFQTPNLPSPPPNPNASTKFPSHLLSTLQASSHLRHPFSQLLSTLSRSAKKVIVIYDSLMGVVVQDVASAPNAEAYMFIPISAYCAFGNLWDLTGRRTDLGIDEEILNRIPSLEGCFSNEFMEFMASQAGLFMKLNSGVLYDTCKVIEGDYLEFIPKLEKLVLGVKTKQWAIGPVNPVKNITARSNRHKCLNWLDKQDKNSVIYVSFGTTTSLTDEQIQEIAKGLEASGERFIWVLREADKFDIFDGEATRRAELPEGYEERIKEKGIVERDWVPQMEILPHPSTGGFMSHCGWNSCLESISMGVPIIAWPMHSDQPRNAALITKGLKIGVAVREWGDGNELVSSLRIEEAVRRLMRSEEGEEIRRRAAEVGGALRERVVEGSITTLELDSFVAHITRME